MAEELRRLYAALYSHCAAKPRAIGLHRRGEIVFKVSGRSFAFMNSLQHPAVTVKAPRRDRKRLLEDPAVQRAGWVGWLGWVTVSVHDDDTLRLAMRLIDRSYDRVAIERRR